MRWWLNTGITDWWPYLWPKEWDKSEVNGLLAYQTLNVSFSMLCSSNIWNTFSFGYVLPEILCLVQFLMNLLLLFLDIQEKKLKRCIFITTSWIQTASLAQWSACLTTNQEVAGLIPGTSTILKIDYHKLRERKVKTLTRNWRDHKRDRHTQTHENWIEIFRLARPSSSIERE